ncbi:MAG: 2'-5' RNA ligase family protein, partial [Burkholderiaceae bacterium]
MTSQFDLFGTPESPSPAVPTDRLFFAILPDPATAARIGAFTQQLSSEHGLRGRPLLADRLHITLHHLGDYAGLPDGLIDSACQAAGQIKTAPFDVTFERVLSFGRKSRNRPIVLLGNQAESGGLADLMSFQKDLYAQMCRAGLQGDKQIARKNANFTPHTTLL